MTAQAGYGASTLAPTMRVWALVFVAACTKIHAVSADDPGTYASCKLVFTASYGGAVGSTGYAGVALSEVRLYDAYNDVLASTISSASSTGEPTTINNVFDNSLSTTWTDTSSSGATLTLTFSSSSVAVKACMLRRLEP